MQALRGDVHDEDSPTHKKEGSREWFSRFMDQDAVRMEGVDDFPRRGSINIAQQSNPDRTLIYDQINKSSKQSNLTVVVEQVSIFLTRDGTVISFFQVLLQLHCSL
jgi:hypothetical protein